MENIVAENAKLKEENKALKEAMEHLQFQLNELKRLVFGSKSERYVPDNKQAENGQMSLFDTPETTAESLVVETQKISYERRVKPTKKHKPTGRHPLPEHLERVEQIIEPEGLTSDMKKIGQEVTESLEYRPAELFVLKIIRPKYVKTQAETTNPIIIADLPTRPIEKAIAGASLLSYLIVSKTVDHLPLYRLHEIFKRDKVRIARSTLGNWLKKCSELLWPLFEKLKEEILRQKYIQVDESSIKVQDRQKKKNIHRGYFWIYYAPQTKLVFFDYHKGRDGAVPKDMLKRYQGFMQVDGYAAYDYFASQKGIDLFFCMAHARRKFEKALANDKKRASWMMDKCQELYAIERQAREEQMTSEERYELRQQKAVPILDQIDAWLEDGAQKVLLERSSGALVEAVKYYYKRKEGLRYYTTNGILEIDNNLIENIIRPLALGRKNYLFAGSHEAAKQLGMYYSFMGSCKMNGINPAEWLKDVLERIPTHPINKIKELLPNNWVKVDDAKIKG